MEHLNRSQIVLLALFVSFVSSVATGIVVVTLMQQMPEPITQSITNVVEKTIERIVPTVIEKPSKPIVMKDEDFLVSAIEHNTKNVVAFKIVGEDGAAYSAGVGVVVSSDGLVVTDRNNFGGGTLLSDIDGVSYTLEVLSNDKDHFLGLGRLKLAGAVSTSTKPVSFNSITLGRSDVLKVGQTAVIIGGRDGKTIATGVITNLDMSAGGDKEPKTLRNIGLSQRLSGTSSGAPIITLDGSIVGFMSVNDVQSTQRGVPVEEAKDIIGTLGGFWISEGGK